MTERGCYCGEFDCPTIAPDEFGETCFHEYDKCEVPPVQVPHSSVLKLAKARAERAEAALARVRELHRPYQSTIWSHDSQQAITVTTCRCGSEQYPCPTIKALDGE